MAVRRPVARKKPAGAREEPFRVAFLVALFGLAMLFGSQLFSGHVNEAPDSDAAPLVRASVPLAPGRQIYYISGSQDGPKMMEFAIDPLDARPGGQQAVEISAGYDAGIDRVTVVIETDTQSVPHDLARISGTAENGVWGSAWMLQKDTYARNYRAIVTAFGMDEKSSSVTVTFR